MSHQWGEISGALELPEQSLELFIVSLALHYRLETQVILFINVFWLVQELEEEVDGCKVCSCERIPRQQETAP